LTEWWTRKELYEKMEGRGGGEAQGVADPKKSICPFEKNNGIKC
jgi:hypothetical protein